jgi:preprotein translocase subunit SecE
MEKLKNLWNLTWDELLNKVTWPTWDELRASTVLVLIASLIFAVIIYTIDYGVGNVLKLIYSMFN